MSITREQVYQALFGLLTPLGPTGTDDFKLVQREVVPVQQIPPGLQPVLMQDEAFEDMKWDAFGLMKNVWTTYLHIGITTPKGTPGFTILNPLIEKVIAQINHTGADVQTLGGLVERVYVKGRAIKDSGDNMTDPKSRQGVCYLPIEIVLPPG